MVMMINIWKKAYKDGIITNFYNKKESKEIPEEKIPNKFLSVIFLYSIIYAYENITPKYF